MRSIPCVIDILEENEEFFWIITVSSSDVSQTALYLSALHNAIVPEIRFQDIRRKEIVAITLHDLSLNNRTVSITPTWLDALLSLFLRVALNGWTDTAHLDGTFSDESSEISITVTITP